jgi:hypothetical protein
MTESHLFLIISAILGTAIVIFGSVYYFTNRWVEVQREKIKAAQIPVRETKQSGTDLKRHYFPLQVDAYQRMVLFLERIAPNNMIIRLSNPGLPARAFQQKLLENIRQEYDHNLAQQIFISKTAWSNVQASKEEIVKIINMASINLDETALANDLAKNIFEITAQLKAQPTDQDIDFLKTELNKILG